MWLSIIFPCDHFCFQKGVSAIVGPSDEKSAVHAGNICDTMEIPFIDTRYDVFSTIPIINMYPDPSTLTQMVTDLVQAAEWQSFTILYENPDWLPHLSKLLELYDPKGDTVTVKRIDVGLPTKNYRAVLRETKMSPDNCVIIECSIESLSEILKQSQQIGLLVDKYQIIITNLDAHTIDLEPYQYGGANITTLRMVDAASAYLSEYAEYMKKMAKDEQKNNEGEENANPDDEEPKNEENPDDGGGGDEPASEDDGENAGDGEDNNEEENEDEEKKDDEKEEEQGGLKVLSLHR